MRKEPKGHGTGQWIESSRRLRAGAPVVVLEDVVTEGKVVAQRGDVVFALLAAAYDEAARPESTPRAYRLEPFAVERGGVRVPVRANLTADSGDGWTVARAKQAVNQGTVVAARGSLSAGIAMNWRTVP